MFGILKILFICEEYLKEIGTGPLSTLMVMRANVRIAIAQVYFFLFKKGIFNVVLLICQTLKFAESISAT